MHLTHCFQERQLQTKRGTPTIEELQTGLELLRSIFHFYTNAFQWTRETVSVTRGTRAIQPHPSPVLRIEDPVESDFDLALPYLDAERTARLKILLPCLCCEFAYLGEISFFGSHRKENRDIMTRKSKKWHENPYVTQVLLSSHCGQHLFFAIFPKTSALRPVSSKRLRLRSVCVCISKRMSCMSSGGGHKMEARKRLRFRALHNKALEKMHCECFLAR